MKSLLYRLSLVLPCIALSSCGGGDGGAAPALATISAANATIITASVVSGSASAVAMGHASGGIAGVSSVGSGSGGAGLVLYTGHPPPPVIVGPFGTGGAPGDGREYAQAVVDPATEGCVAGGTVTVSGVVAAPGTLSAGDSAQATFAACGLGDGFTATGRFDLVVNSFAGDLLAGSYRLDTAATVSSLQISGNGVAATLSGDVTLLIDTLTSPLLDEQLSGGSLTIRTAGGTDTLSDFAFNDVVDRSVSPGSYTRDVHGTLAGSHFDGSVDFRTTIPLQGSGVDYPAGGQVLITGKNGATIRVTAEDDVNVRLDLDLNGDGVVDQTLATTWQELLQ